MIAISTHISIWCKRALGVLSLALLALQPHTALSQTSPSQAITRDASNTAEKRVALVIGNSSYKHAPLVNPVNDARDMSARLRQLGFDVVERNDLNARQIGGALREFRSKLRPGAVAVVFYAGHGLQIKGENYLPAVDAEIDAEEDVPNQSLSVKQVMDVLDDAKTRLNLVFLDACRNNPYARSFRSAGNGLAKVTSPTGTLISFATRPGSVASDGAGKNGLYTEQLLLAMNHLDLPIELALKRVVSGVKAKSAGKQEPWMEGSIEGDFCFGRCNDGTQGVGAMVANAPAVSAALAAAPVTVPVPLPSPGIASNTRPAAREDAETALWNEVKASGAREYLDVYLQQYPKGKYLALAKLELKKLDDAANTERERQAAQRAQDEQAAWDSAKASNTEAAYSVYANAYPQGRFAALALAAQQRLKSDAEEKRRLETERVQREQAEMRPGKVYKDCSDCPEMVVIPAGSFQMGGKSDNELPVHKVTFAQTFAIGKTEITQAQWHSVMGTNPSHFKTCGADCPIENVNWHDAQDFISELNTKTGKQYRLPSEAEWEYACRAGGRHEYCGSDDVNAIAWYDDNSAGVTHIVAKKQANAFGLHDMSGNVWELVDDYYHDFYYGAPRDGNAWVTGSDKPERRVLRGGSWGNVPIHLRSPNRKVSSRDFCYYNCGFRLAHSLP